MRKQEDTNLVERLEPDFRMRMLEVVRTERDKLGRHPSPLEKVEWASVK